MLHNKMTSLTPAGCYNGHWTRLPRDDPQREECRLKARDNRQEFVGNLLLLSQDELQKEIDKWFQIKDLTDGKQDSVWVVHMEDWGRGQYQEGRKYFLNENLAIQTMLRDEYAANMKRYEGLKTHYGKEPIYACMFDPEGADYAEFEEAKQQYTDVFNNIPDLVSNEYLVGWLVAYRRFTAMLKGDGVGGRLELHPLYS